MTEQKLRDQLQKFLDWNKRHPKSAVNLDMMEIKKEEIELDDLMAETQDLMEEKNG